MAYQIFVRPIVEYRFDFLAARVAMDMSVPLIFSFRFMVVAYVIHVIDESLLGGSVVEKIRRHWWPEYSWRKFFWFNAGYFVIMLGSRPNPPVLLPT
jgi:hypothetical protein